MIDVFKVRVLERLNEAPDAVSNSAVIVYSRVALAYYDFESIDGMYDLWRIGNFSFCSFAIIMVAGNLMRQR
jgi:hypothetical protein